MRCPILQSLSNHLMMTGCHWPRLRRGLSARSLRLTGSHCLGLLSLVTLGPAPSPEIGRTTGRYLDTRDGGNGDDFISDFCLEEYERTNYTEQHFYKRVSNNTDGGYSIVKHNFIRSYFSVDVLSISPRFVRTA